MINPDTAKVLSLKPVTLSECHDLYLKINTEFQTPDAVQESVSWWQDNPEKLNKLWWTLNYHSEQFDPERRIRALIERHLDGIAHRRKESSQA
ncbi:MAG: hypothetical protein K9J83_06180 [Desulfarculaceae bacterium]|nr:hypothetical protein [Desulfarculaceae bacterium]